jgi:oligosaccharide repeat unit polymerase
MLDISFWAYIYIFIGLATFVQVSNHVIPWVDYGEESHLIFQSIIIFFLGIISFIFGRYSKINLVFPFRTVSHKRVNYLFFLSFLSLLLIFTSLGFETIFYPRTAFTLLKENETGSINLLTALLQTSLFISLIGYLMLYQKKSISIISMLPCIVICLVYFNPIRSDRLSFLIFYILIFLFYSRFNKKLWAFSLIFGLVFLFPMLDFFRVSLQGNNAVTFDLNKNMITGDFDALSTLIMSINYVQYNDFLYFTNFFTPFFVLIPRIIWPSKPFSSSFLLTNDSNVEFSNIAASMWSEGFLGFGYIGVLLLFFSIGIAIRNLNSYYNKSDFITIITIYFIPFMIFFLRGDMYNLGFKVIPMIFWAYLVTKKSK